ncbi:MAG: transglycosylase domain-containing protein, partial [Spirochaetaceae bacterium]|nr:transglycosylase domain-containing protein [Spirochaetaceae bacterium]
MTAAGRAGFLIPSALLGALVASAIGRASPEPPPPTPWIEDRRGGYLTEDLAKGGDLGFWEVGAEDNPALVAAVLATEDRRFYAHPGVDPVGIARAIVSTIGGRRQGGSTLAMQAVRLCDPAPRGLASKLSEAAAAVMATAVLGRRAILELYLATMPQGGRLRGAGYAARRYFGKPVADLSLAECALLAAIPNSPSSLNLLDPSGFAAARDRANLVLGLMESRGTATREDCALARKELERIGRPAARRRPEDSLHYIVRALAESRLGGIDRLSGPIAASLDPDLQRAAASIVGTALAENARFGAANAAMIAADARTGEVLAYVGSGGYFDQAGSGSIDYATRPRSAGSALKPFLYALGLDSGLF